jgi:hypothetical protein
MDERFINVKRRPLHHFEGWRVKETNTGATLAYEYIKAHPGCGIVEVARAVNRSAASLFVSLTYFNLIWTDEHDGLHAIDD